MRYLFLVLKRVKECVGAKIVLFSSAVFLVFSCNYLILFHQWVVALC